MGLSKVVRCFSAAAVLASGMFLPAQNVRITGAIDSSRTTALPGSVSARLKAAVDLGLVAPDRQLTGMAVRFAMTDVQQAALSQLLADQVNPGSPHYHQWLSPEQFAVQFGLAPADIAKVSSWLTDQGFTVTETARAGASYAFPVPSSRRSGPSARSFIPSPSTKRSTSRMWLRLRCLRRLRT